MTMLQQQDLLMVTKDEINECHEIAMGILDETQADDEGSSEVLTSDIDPELLCSLHIHYSAINRNKRCALAYLYVSTATVALTTVPTVREGGCFTRGTDNGQRRNCD
jgi:hypothetical protein